MMELTKGFDWQSAQQDTVCRSFGAVAVYRNKEGDVVIRQRSVDTDRDQDSVVVLPVVLAEQLVMKLAAIAPKRRVSERPGDVQAKVRPLTKPPQATEVKNG